MTAPDMTDLTGNPLTDRFVVRRLDPVVDAPLVHGWVTQDRARFWGMLDKTVEEVRDVYAFVDSLPTHHAFLVLERRDGDHAPVALVQTYEPEHDPLGEHYDVQPGDVGVHLLVAEGPVRTGFTGALVGYLVEWLFRDPDAQRIVVEPDVLNDRSVARFVRSGFVRGPVLDLGHKTAQLAFLPRPA